MNTSVVPTTTAVSLPTVAALIPTGNVMADLLIRLFDGNSADAYGFLLGHRTVEGVEAAMDVLDGIMDAENHADGTYLRLAQEEALSLMEAA